MILSAASVQRMIALVKHEVNQQDMFMLHELQPSSAPTTGGAAGRGRKTNRRDHYLHDGRGTL